MMKTIRIRRTDLEFVREPLRAPFGFKGRSLTELWQTVAKLESESYTAVAPCVESVLWSDGQVFGENPPAVSSAMMMLVTNRALKLLEGESFTTPPEVIYGLLPELKRYAEQVCGHRVATTFVLNALVGVDCALWMLYAQENGITSFDGLIPASAREALSCRHDALAQIPLLSYAVPEEEIRSVLDSGISLLKIKIGKAVPGVSTPEEDMAEMLKWDISRLRQIHGIASQYETPHTKNGKVLYYLDANGRYDSLSRVEALLDAADKMGALDRIALLEEPFAPENHTFVGNLPVCVNADESAHSLEDVQERLSLGYKAVALKPIAKTVSVSFRMAEAIHAAGGQCLCADLTVNPLLAEWNKQFAARVPALAGMKVGCVEINGDQNYTDWKGLQGLLPDGLLPAPLQNGVFPLDGEFYAQGECLFRPNGYESYFRKI